MVKVFTDGGARGNPGPAACAFVVYEENPSTSSGSPALIMRVKRGKYLGTATNNEAEYAGVIEALASIPEDNLQFFLDSLLVVNQLNGLWKIKEPRLRELQMKVKILEHNRQITYSHIPRAKNKLADLLVNETLDSQMR